jgi:hypothetical protein
VEYAEMLEIWAGGKVGRMQKEQAVDIKVERLAYYLLPTAYFDQYDG